MKLKAVIIDDEEHCLNTLQWQLNQYCSNDVEVIALFTDPEKAVDQIPFLKPDIIFTDIKMPTYSGLELAAQVESFVENVIFTTAYDQYAIKAIKLNVLDYLLKPIDKSELVAAIEKIKNRNANKISAEPINNQELRKSKFINKIALNNNDGMSFISLDNIIYVEGDSAYSIFHLVNQKKVVISKTLAYVEEILDEPYFFRVHKSYIANLKYVENYIRGDGGEIIMSNGVSLSLSRNKKEQFLKIFSKA
jgi:two-component system LytT family response regulator